MYTHTYIHSHIYIYIHTHIYVYTCRVFSNMYMYIYIYIYVCMYTHTYTYIYIYIHTHIYVHTCRVFRALDFSSSAMPSTRSHLQRVNTHIRVNTYVMHTHKRTPICIYLIYTYIYIYTSCASRALHLFVIGHELELLPLAAYKYTHTCKHIRHAHTQTHTNTNQSNIYIHVPHIIFCVSRALYVALCRYVGVGVLAIASGCFHSQRMSIHIRVNTYAIPTHKRTPIYIYPRTQIYIYPTYTKIYVDTFCASRALDFSLSAMGSSCSHLRWNFSRQSFSSRAACSTCGRCMGVSVCVCVCVCVCAWVGGYWCVCVCEERESVCV